MLIDLNKIGVIFRLLENRDKKVIFIISCFQVLVNFLDLLGVALLGMLGSLSVRGIQAQGAGNRVKIFLSFLNINNSSLQKQVIFLGGIAVTALLSRTIISIYLSRKTLRFLASRGARISTTLYEKLLNENILDINKKPIQLTIYSLGSGVTNLILGVIAVMPSLISDLSLLLILFFSLLIVDPTLTILSFVLFTLIFIFMHFSLHEKVRKFGEGYTDLNIQSNEIVERTIISFREMFVRNLNEEYLKKYSNLRIRIANLDASIRFMPNITKYVIEIAIVLSAILLSAYQFLKYDASVAVGTLTLFLAALTRIGPAFLRIQQSVISINNSLANSYSTMQILGTTKYETEKNIKKSEENKLNFNDNDNGLSNNIKTKLELINVCFSYNKGNPILQDINAVIESNTITAIVGKSGSGKSTLMDLMLGLIEPTSGTITISGIKPIEVIKKWSGIISYVPQEVRIYEGSIKNNVCFGHNVDLIEDQKVVEILRRVQLESLIEDSSQGVHMQIDERGSSLSGGQRQRLGLARALVGNPKLIFLDEATSALDGSTEFQLTHEILGLKKSSTIILIAHRMSTLKIADCILYILPDGKVGFFGKANDFETKLNSGEFGDFIIN